MKKLLLVPMVLGVTFFSFAQPKPADTNAWRESAIKAGSAVIEKHQCTRCHAIEGEKDWPRDMSCRGCHEWIMETKGDPEAIKERKKKFKQWDKYLRNITHYTDVPDLSKLGSRVNASFIESYLAAPFDLRPVMEESMIRNQLTEEERKILARYFAAKGGAPDPKTTKQMALPPKKDALVTEGEDLFREKGCASCHLFANKDFGAQVDAAFLADMKPFSALAPDLRFAKEKVRPDVLLDWIVDPKSVDPDTKMPVQGVSRDEAEAIAQFLWYGDPGAWMSEAPATKKAKGRKVTYAILEREIFKKICEHCHMDEGSYDNGAGNGGGMGYQGRGLSLESFASFKKGSKQEDGTYASILRPGKSGRPILIERLERRKEENKRDMVKPFAQLGDQTKISFPSEGPGMPLGLPALTEEQLQMIQSWIDAGAPGPDGKKLLP
jgi:mono/diheme cytochrome c family protein